MARPWTVIESVSTGNGLLELRQRGPRDLLILRDGRVLMTSAQQRSEQALGTLVGRAVEGRAAPRVLIAGLGMGFTLRAALDALPPLATVEVAELHEVVVRWARGPLAELTGRALEDPRVRVEIGDVAKIIEATSSGGSGARRFDAIALDLFEGPRASPSDPFDGHLFGASALARARASLMPGGVLAVWSEGPVRSFEERLRSAGFQAQVVHPARGARRYVIYLARP